MTDTTTLIDLFCRKSRTKAGKGKREISISAQETRGRAVAAQLGLTVRHVWREVGSASRFRRKKSARTDQDKALAALERGEIGALWVYRLDRWDRRGAGAILRIVEPEDGRPRRLLFDNGDPESPGIGLDSSNPRDRSELIRRAEAAREETEILSERVRSTKAHQRENGEWVSAHAPYGLRVVLVDVEDEDGDIVTERKLEIDDSPAGAGRSKADVARDILVRMLVQEGLSGYGVINRLEEIGISGLRGRRWAYSTIHGMAHNPAYAGWQISGRQEGGTRRMLYRNPAGERVSVMQGPSLLTDDELRAAQAALRGEQGRGVPRDGSKHDTRPRHLLTGLVRCGVCGGAMSFTGNGYRCGSGCVSVARKSIEEWVHYRWHERLNNSEVTDPFVAAVAERWAAQQDPDGTEDAARARKALAAAESDLARVWADRKAGLYDGPSESFFAPALAEANAAVVEARKAADAAGGKRRVDVTFLLDPESCGDVWESADLAKRRELLRITLERVRVFKAPYRGCPFDGWKRTEFTWVGGETEPAEEG
ncbi:recombinase family protein [Streptomyces lycii]|uniref:Recombinase family protein n=1 Tax=Streptomyces lycii TaxID=2654337 RepID=A0ABQ7FN41_9ACTN|nr:recombinase family protein [Streptomyces lycii]KAF4408668.1 recombinase family protein [Streptomyces lycii]